MLTKPTRLRTALLMLPTWGFAHAVLLLQILPGKELFFVNKQKSHLACLIGCALCAIFASLIGARRAVALGWRFPRILALLIHVPFAGGGLAFWLAAASDTQERNSSCPTAVAGRLVVPLILSTFACIALTWGFDHLATKNPGAIPLGLKQTGGYFGWAIFAALPFAAGMSSGVIIRRAGGTFGQAVAAAMTVIGTVILILCAMAMEGIVCVAMAAPFGTLLTFLGAVAGYFVARSKTDSSRLQSAAWLPIVIIVCIEGRIPPAPLEGSAATEIVIDAPAARVWAELHNIHDLPQTKNILFQLVVAHPVGTMTDGEGVGAKRLCKLSTGDMPEVITVWKPGEELRFKVLSTPPSMHELGFFGFTIDAAHLHSAYASLEGGFRLVSLGDGRTRVVGESRYLLNIAPAPYWNLWTKEIVHMIHHRVLQHIKAQAEQSPRESI